MIVPDSKEISLPIDDSSQYMRRKQQGWEEITVGRSKLRLGANIGRSDGGVGKGGRSDPTLRRRDRLYGSGKSNKARKAGIIRVSRSA